MNSHELIEESNNSGTPATKSSSKPTKKIRPRNDLVHYSKALSKVLRHTAKANGLQIREDGYIEVDSILKLPQFRGMGMELLLSIVKGNDKKRFTMEEVEGVLYIRANQGHSIKAVQVPMARIDNASSIPKVVHGTKKELWPVISKQGLSRMKRNHIHCATGLYGDPGVISGIRKSCTLYIYIDSAKAMQDGVEFYRSENGVILTEGVNGLLSSKYFSRVETSDGEVLLDAKASPKNNRSDESDQSDPESIDPFCDNLQALSMHELELLEEKHSNFGYSEGIIKGKMQVAQSGFDDGFKHGSRLGFQMGKTIGTLKAKLYIFEENEQMEILKQELDRLQESAEFHIFVANHKEEILKCIREK